MTRAARPAEFLRAFRSGMQQNFIELSDEDCDSLLEVIEKAFDTRAPLPQIIATATRQIESLQPQRFTRGECRLMVQLAIQIHGVAR